MRSAASTGAKIDTRPPNVTALATPLGPPAEDYVLTRAQAARLLGVHVSTIRHYEGRLLHPEKRGGVHYFSSREVEALRDERPSAPYPGLRKYLDDGELCARAVALFDQGTPLRAIVVELRIPFAAVREMWADYRTPLGEEVRSPETIRLEDERHDRRMARIDEQIDGQIRRLSQTPRIGGRPRGRPRKATARSSPASVGSPLPSSPSTDCEE